MYEKLTGKMILKCYYLLGKTSVLVSAYGVHGVCVHECVWCVCALCSVCDICVYGVCVVCISFCVSIYVVYCAVYVCVVCVSR